MDILDHHRQVSDVVLALSDLPANERDKWLAENEVPDAVREEALALLAFDEPEGTLPDGAGMVLGSLASDLAALPEQVGPYRIVRRLGRGAMGEVFAARRPHPDREVALKVVRTRLTGQVALARFHMEVELLARLDHPGIVTLLEAGTTVLSDGSEAAWFAMPLVEGRTLDEAAQDWPIRDKVELVARVCDAVAHAHERGVVHRDLKPANVLVDGARHPHVLDFGIARSVTGGTGGETRTGMVIGTVAYMSPEQARGDVAATDSRTDVYALGVVLYELLAGRLPIDVVPADLLESARRIVESEPAPMASSIPTDLALIARTCLEKDPRRRYATAHALADDLRNWLAQRPVTARPPSLAYQLTRLVQRNRAATIGGSAVLLAAALGLAGTLSGYRQARIDRDEALAEQARATAVEDYLLATFSAASADRLGREATVGAAIDASLPALEQQLASEPTAQARVKLAIARLYYALDRYDDASALVDEALPVLAEQLSPDAEEVLRSEALHAQLLVMSGDEQRAIDLLADVVARSEAAHGVRAPVTLDVTAAWLRLAEERLEPAERVRRARQLVEAANAAVGAAGPQTLDARGQLGRALWAAGEVEAAEQELRDVLAVAEGRYGVDGVETLRRRRDLLDLLDDQQRYTERIPLLQAQLAAQERRLGPTHTDTRHTLSKLGKAQLALGQKAEARASYALLLERRPPVESASVEERLDWYAELAAASRDLGDPAQSEALSREGLALAADLPPSNHYRGRLALHLARAVFTQGRQEEAVPLYEEALPLLEASLGEADEITLKGRKDLGTTLAMLGRLEEALPHYDKVIEVGSARLGDSHVIVRAALRESGEALMGLKRYDEARERLVAYRQAQDASGKPAPLFYVQALLELSKLQRLAPHPSLAGVPQEARDYMRDVCPKDPACKQTLQALVDELGAP